MDNKPTILDYLSQVFMIFGIAVLTLNIFCLLFGDSAREISSIFTLGSGGLTVTTSFQFLLAIGITILFRFIFMTDFIIKKMPLAARIITMFAAAFLNIMVFVILCGWFPVDNIMAWIMFLISFAISCAVSTAVSLLKEKMENRKLAEALNRLKEEEE